MLKRWKCGRVEGWKGGRMEGGGFLNRGFRKRGVEGWKSGECLNRRLHGLHGLRGEERLLSAIFSFNVGTSIRLETEPTKESRNQRYE